MAVSPGARARSSLLAALFIIIIIIIFLKLSRKVMKLGTHVRAGKILGMQWFAKVGVAKWLDSATYKFSTKCILSYVSRTCMKIGTHM